MIDDPVVAPQHTRTRNLGDGLDPSHQIPQQLEHAAGRILLGGDDLRTLLLLLRLLVVGEQSCWWPESIQLVIIVLLARADGGFRPIGLLPLSRESGRGFG